MSDSTDPLTPWRFLMKALGFSGEHTGKQTEKSHLHLLLIGGIVVLVFLIIGGIPTVIEFHEYTAVSVLIILGIVALGTFTYWVLFRAYYAIYLEEFNKRIAAEKQRDDSLAREATAKQELAKFKNDFLAPKIEIIAKEDKGELASGRDLHWRVSTRNISDIAAECQLQIIACEPHIGNLPLPLRPQHETSTKITLQPGEERRWDVCRDDMNGGLEFIGVFGVEKAPIRYHWPPEKFTTEYLKDPKPPPPPIDRQDSCKIQIKAFSATGKSPDPMWFELVWIDRGLVLRPVLGELKEKVIQ
jgi:hypothetical protein